MSSASCLQGWVRHSRAAFLFGGSSDRLQPEPQDWPGLIPGHKQPLTSPPPRAAPRPGRRPPRGPARSPIVFVSSPFLALHSQSRRRALAHRPGAASTSLLPTLSPRTAKRPAALTHTPTAAAALRAPTQSPPQPAVLPRPGPAPSRIPPPGSGPRASSRPLRRLQRAPAAPPPRVLNNCPLGRPAGFPRP